MTERGEDGKGLNKTQTTGESKGNVNMELEMSKVKLKAPTITLV